MNGPPWHNLDTVARNAAPTLLLLFLVILGQLPFSLPGDSAVTPYFVLMAVFYWGLHRPDLLPAAVVFVVGLLQDALEGEPFGVNAFVLIAVYWFVSSQQRHFGERPFLVLWLIFGLIGLAAETLRWLLVAVLTTTMLTPWSVAFEYLMTVALYPLLTIAFALAQRALPRGGGNFMD
ncbi:MAG: rod shape-determining protein MreD [Alphaproteobacteria bacterium]|nr:rod shape-determining protein MreD [Alphaproteobacteria bacterium]